MHNYIRKNYIEVFIVTIIMPAYNAEKYIAESIGSILIQTYTNWELIVVDDGSIDNTKTIVESFSANDKRVKYIYQVNGRQGKARNTGIENSLGKYIAFLDADDLWHPEKLEKQIICIEETGADIVFAGCHIFEESTESNLQEYYTPTGFITKFYNSELFFKMNPVPILTVLVRKECLHAVGCFTEEYRLQNAEDYHLWIKLLMENFIFYGMEEKLSFYRKHQEQTTIKDYYATIQVINVLQSFDDIPGSLKRIKKKRIQALYVRLLNFSNLYEKQDLEMTMKVYFIKSLQQVLYPVIKLAVILFGINFTLKLFIKAL
jgi:teichuronic acid biosynthesis glycosyltransferase TuaG